MKVKDINLTTGCKNIATKCLTIRCRNGGGKRKITIIGKQCCGLTHSFRTKKLLLGKNTPETIRECFESFSVSSQNADFDAVQTFNGYSLKESTVELSKPIMNT